MKKMITVLTAVILLMGTAAFAASSGQLYVSGFAGVGDVTSPHAQPHIRLVIADETSGPVVALANDLDLTAVFRFKAGQADHLSTIPRALYDYYLFEDAAEGNTPALRIYGYETGASASSYGSMQISGTDGDLGLTASSATARTLTPGINHVCDPVLKLWFIHKGLQQLLASIGATIQP